MTTPGGPFGRAKEGLKEAVGITKVDEENTAEVASSLDPARQ